MVSRAELGRSRYQKLAGWLFVNPARAFADGRALCGTAAGRDHSQAGVARP
jgi:hypothetical protein